MEFIDLTGKRFGRLFAIAARRRHGATTKWLCRCDCGAEKEINSRSLREGATLSCGCYNREVHRLRAGDYTDKTFNRWTGIKRIGTAGSKWLWRCICGTERAIGVGSVTRGYTQSCGCYRDEMAVKTHTRHSQSKTQIYNIWTGMKQRCSNPKFRQFKDYGGRGISVCEEWSNSFKAFYRDMGNPPPGMTIDRVNNNGNYEPGNCKWSSPVQQSENRRSQSKERRITHNGLTLTISDWARRTGIPRTRIYYRLGAEWPIDKILTPDPILPVSFERRP